MEFLTKMNRREFLKTAGFATGAAAGAAALYSFLPHVVFAEGGESVFAASTVLQPSFAAPAIVKSGAYISALIPSRVETVDALWLQRLQPSGGKDEIKLEIGAPTERRYPLKPESPPPAGMYDLYARVTRGGNSRIERQPLAVKVVEEFKENFVFGVVSDVHFGDPRISSKIPGFDVGETLRKEIEIFNERGVEFCLCCGDLCFIPPKTKKEIMEYAETLSIGAKFPTFLVPGNHDGYATGAPGRVNFDTLEHYQRYFGALNFESGYGDVSIIGVNTFDKVPDLRNLYGGHGEDVDTGAVSAEQLAWLDGALARASNSKSVIMFGHHNPTNTVKDVNGPFTIVPFSEEGRGGMLGLIKKYEPEAYFCGHVHGIHEETYGKTRIFTAPTAASLPAEGHPVAIQIVKVAGGKIDSLETIEIARA